MSNRPEKSPGSSVSLQILVSFLQDTTHHRKMSTPCNLKDRGNLVKPVLKKSTSGNFNLDFLVFM